MSRSIERPECPDGSASPPPLPRPVSGSGKASLHIIELFYHRLPKKNYTGHYQGRYQLCRATVTGTWDPIHWTETPELVPTVHVSFELGKPRPTTMNEQMV